MKIKIYFFGKIKNSAFKELTEYYLKLASKNLKIEVVNLKSIEERKIELKDIENLKITSQTYFLSEFGKTMSTEKFCNLIAQNRDNSEEMNFIFGNSFGLSDEIKSKYKLLSLSEMTYNHELSLVLMAEQLFRASDQISGGKYNK